MSRTIRLGGCSMKERMGHPAEHLPHWKQRRTELPDSASTFLMNPTFIVSCDNSILVFLMFFMRTVSVAVPPFPDATRY
jgi:hypothetical protein